MTDRLDRRSAKGERRFDGRARFAHPAEWEIARLFDEHRIAWLYEPHMLVLERDGDGRIREALTPDFYLPDFDLYVECTVMCPTLANRKRRKIRKARDKLGVTVEILARADLDVFARRWRVERLARALD